MATKSPAGPVGSPSIREIARVAGVAPSTVSRAFNAVQNGASVSVQTRSRIERVCRELNYHPNAHATRLFAGRSNAIGLVVPPWGNVLPDMSSFSDPNLAKTLAGVTDEAALRRQELVLMSSDEAFVTSQEYLRILRSRAVDGLMIWGARQADRDFVAEIMRDGWPLVLMNSSISVDDVSSVQVDNHSGGRMMARRLVDLGHRTIGYVAGSAGVRAADERLAGFECVCRENHIDLRVRQGTFQFEAGRALAGELLNQDQPPTAIAATSDLMALGVIEAAEDRGLRVPEDLSVTGGDGAFPYNKPCLESFAAPMEDVGRRGLAMLLDWITNGRRGEDTTLDVSHVAGATVAPPRS